MALSTLLSREDERDAAVDEEEDGEEEEESASEDGSAGEARLSFAVFALGVPPALRLPREVGLSVTIARPLAK